MNGLYGQAQGNELRNGIAVRDERYLDNEMIEGEHVANIRDMIVRRDWRAVTGYTTILKVEGWSQRRIDSMVASAGVGVKL